MIKRLLQQNEKLCHVIITNRMNTKEKEVIDALFADKDIKKRLITILPTTSDYKILFKCADVFIDSFPIFGALTQIDLISMRIPTVVKINLKNPFAVFSRIYAEIILMLSQKLRIWSKE